FAGLGSADQRGDLRTAVSGRRPPGTLPPLRRRGRRTRPHRAGNPVAGSGNGEGGIRTLGTVLPVHTLSRRAPSTTRSPLQARRDSTGSYRPAIPFPSPM